MFSLCKQLVLYVGGEQMQDISYLRTSSFFQELLHSLTCEVLNICTERLYDINTVTYTQTFT